MTKEEAIKIINCYDIGFYDLSGEKIPADKLSEAFDMAIEALDCSESPNSSDTISRQAAIDALADMHCKSDEDGYAWIRSDAWARIDALPSAQPEPCEDAVSREEAKWVVFCHRDHIEDQANAIDELPSVTPKQKCGKWNAYYHGINETPSFTYSCNQCGYSAPYGLYGGKYSQKKWNFCPNCGADMRSKDDNF